MIGRMHRQQYQSDDGWPSRLRRVGQTLETLGFVSSVQSVTGPPWSTLRTCLSRRRAVHHPWWMPGGDHDCEDHGILHFVLSVRTLASPHDQDLADVFLCRRRAPKISEGFTKHGLVLLRFRKHDKVCDRVSLKKECQLTDETERMRQSPIPLETARFATLITVKMAAIT